jgi:hypothetical protein
VPLVANAPVQPPEALHELAPVELQVSMEDPPLAMEVGLAVSETVGGDGFGVTGTDPDPPQAVSSSAAPIGITGAKQRIRIFSNSRIMSAAVSDESVRTRATTAASLAHSCAASRKRHPSAASIT